MSTLYSLEIQQLQSTSTRPVITAGLWQTNEKITSAVASAATTDIDSGDVIHMLMLPSNAFVHSLNLLNTDMDSNGTPTLAVHVGVYAAEKQKVGSTTYAAGQAISNNCFAAASTLLQAANLGGTSVRFSNSALTTADKQLWQIAGLASDPGAMMYISLTVSTGAATAAAGTIVLQARTSQQ